MAINFACPIFAFDGDAVDLAKNGSISITLLDKANNLPQSGAVFVLYRVADVFHSGYNLTYRFSSDFLNCGISLDDIREDGIETHLSAYADEHDLQGLESGATDTSGFIAFSNLTTGLYLLRQTKAVNGYYITNSFLVSVPMTIDSKWIYDVDASPKVEVKPEHQETQLTVKKVWINNNTTNPDEIRIALMRDGTVFKTVTLGNMNQWFYTWQGLDNAYIWTAAELDVPDGYAVSYSTNENTLTITNKSTADIPAIPSSENKNSPTTGDNGNLYHWFTVLLFSSIGLCICLIIRNHKFNKSSNTC